MDNIFAMKIYVFISVCMYVVMASDFHDNDRPIVKITNGPIQGNKQIILDKTVYTFLGVPYAEPPIHSRRFQRSVPVQSTWTTPLPCLQYQSSCPQHRFLAEFFDRTNPNGTEMRTSEDCLYLNIFTPTIRKDKPLPVMVWIHSGSFIYGSGAWWHGQTLASVENVVVVNINYRLGLLGYLGVRNKAGQVIIEPNLSLLDQNLALNWIQENIHQFGGDSKNVVLAGHSAGAVAASYHLFLPISRGLFHNVALYGGSCLMLRINNKRWSDVDRIFGLVLSKTTCNNTDDGVEESVECLKKLSVNELLTAQLELIQSEFFPFRPAIDSVVVPDDPQILLEQGLINPAHNVLLGTTQDEGFTVAMRIPHYQHGISSEALMFLVNLVYNKYPSEIRSLIVHQYTNYSNNKDALDNLEIANRLFTQGLFQAPIAQMADLLAKYNYSCYMFIFDHRTIGSAYYPDYVGVIHQMEIPYVFGYPLHHPDYVHDNYTADDNKVSKYMMAMISNMARNR